MRYRIRATPTGQRLTVWDPARTQEEANEVEGLEFDCVADALHFVGVNYPDAHEEE